VEKAFIAFTVVITFMANTISEITKNSETTKYVNASEIKRHKYKRNHTNFLI